MAKTGVETDVSQQFRKTGVETGQQLFSLSVNQVCLNSGLNVNPQALMRNGDIPELPTP